MSERSWEDPFRDYPVYARLPIEVRARMLRDLGHEAAAGDLLSPRTAAQTRSIFGFGLGVMRRPRAWEHMGHTFGFVPTPRRVGESLRVFNAGQIVPDRKLRHATVTLSLDKIRIADYPGGSHHRILFGFYGCNTLFDGAQEHLHYAATLRVAEGQSAVSADLPIFVNLNVGDRGLSFGCRTVDVADEASSKALDLLDSDAVRTGLRLSLSPQAAIPPLSQMSQGLTKAILACPRNLGVQDFQLGLDFDADGDTSGARIAEGLYFAVQVEDPAAWSWSEWVWEAQSCRLIAKSDPFKVCPYNYLVFRVSRRPNA